MAGVLLGGKPGTGYQDQCYRCIFQEIDPELSGGAFAKPPVELTDSSDGLFFIFLPVDQLGDCECILGACKFLFGFRICFQRLEKRCFFNCGHFSGEIFI